MAIASIEAKLVFPTISLYVGSMVLGYGVTSTFVDLLAQKILGQKMPQKPKVFLSLLWLICIIPLSLISPHRTFLSLCTAYVALSILLMRAESQEQEKANLPSFMTDLVEEAKLKKECFYSGYEKYITELEVILCQQEKNSGILVGPSGVGKSAIFEMIAWKIAHDKFPNSPFNGRRLIKIDITAFMAGTSLRGDVESRIEELLDLAKSDPTVIFVIDEIHKIVSTGGHDENEDIANQLKPALARPGLTIFGATTPDAFTKYFEKDLTIERRFKKVTILEPSSSECLQMLKNRRKQKYFHIDRQAVTVSDKVLKAVIFFSKLDTKTKSLPDVASSLLDSVRARCIRDQMCKQNSQDKLVITLEHVITQHTSDPKNKKRCPEELKAQFNSVQATRVFDAPRVFSEVRILGKLESNA